MTVLFQTYGTKFIKATEATTGDFWVPPVLGNPDYWLGLNMSQQVVERNESYIAFPMFCYPELIGGVTLWSYSKGPEHGDSDDKRGVLFDAVGAQIGDPWTLFVLATGIWDYTPLLPYWTIGVTIIVESRAVTRTGTSTFVELPRGASNGSSNGTQFTNVNGVTYVHSRKVALRTGTTLYRSGNNQSITAAAWVTGHAYSIGNLVTTGATLWATGQAVAIGVLRTSKSTTGYRIYQAASAGVAGSIQPDWTSGTQTDGGVLWTYVCDGAGLMYRATSAGTSGATIPTWHTGSGSDGVVSWDFVQYTNRSAGLFQSTNAGATWSLITLPFQLPLYDLNEATFIPMVSGLWWACARENTREDTPLDLGYIYWTTSTNATPTTWNALQQFDYTLLAGVQPDTTMFNSNKFILTVGDRNGTSGFDAAGRASRQRDTTGVTAYLFAADGLSFTGPYPIGLTYSTDGGQYVTHLLSNNMVLGMFYCRRNEAENPGVESVLVQANRFV